MKQEDSDIKAYFSKLKQAENKHIEIPPFTVPKKHLKKKLYQYAVPLTIAATLLLLFGLRVTTQTKTLENETLLITLTVDDTNTTDQLITNETSMSNWKSPTSILIQEFED